MIAAPLKSLPRDFLITLKKRLLIFLLLIFFVWLLVLIRIWTAIVEDELYAVPDFTVFQDDESFIYEYRGSEAAHERSGALKSAVGKLRVNRANLAMVSKHAKQVLSNASCHLPAAALADYRDCATKLQWMKEGWKSHSCYAEHGVDGSLCSFVIYLSEVENHCPTLEWRRRFVGTKRTTAFPSAEVQRDLSGLLKLMYDSDVNYKFIKERISRLWPKWLQAFDYNLFRLPKSLQHRRRLNVVVHMGFLSKEAGFKFGEKSAGGGPLGELVQWSDLLSALYVLGHNLFISTESATFKSNLANVSEKTPCYTASSQGLHLIFTDIVGVRYMRREMKRFFLENRCLLRVLDSFGTHAEFNLQSYFLSHKAELGGRSNPWGGSGLELQQFMTMYPHTDDNTFLGFVVETHIEDETLLRTNDTLVYGKEIYMWNGSDELLDKVAQFSQLHATVADATELRGRSVINHGLLSGFELHSLLRKVKVFLGLGFPLEGPAPLEAIANGAVFINPAFHPPRSRKTYAFFEEKPTLRELTSQNSYVERFIGRPHVITVDITDMHKVEEAMKEALSSKPTPYLPFEFTTSGMLQRVNVLISKQNFCTSANFPPRSAAHIVYANRSQSCEKSCREHGLICERSFFDIIDQESIVNRNGNCDRIMLVASPLAPYNCHRQAERMLFSCASVPQNDEIQRICPCRDFIAGQIALCSLCL
uniref:alpha-1,6-mannosyl-glycoprotein 6-beta-N-acetylglucosaminyltransferase n=2 Tax=Parascaris univalens TaxID=6257 RepID=A0A914ZVG1_PARUN